MIQGALGDCWFIGALSVLATEDAFIRGSFDPEKNTDNEINNYEAKGMTSGVYPPMFHYLRKYGMYVFRFFKDDGWRYVIVDDRLPCYKKSYGIRTWCLAGADPITSSGCHSSRRPMPRSTPATRP